MDRTALKYLDASNSLTVASHYNANFKEENFKHFLRSELAFCRDIPSHEKNPIFHSGFFSILISWFSISGIFRFCARDFPSLFPIPRLLEIFHSGFFQDFQSRSLYPGFRDFRDFSTLPKIEKLEKNLGSRKIPFGSQLCFKMLPWFGSRSLCKSLGCLPCKGF